MKKIHTLGFLAMLMLLSLNSFAQISGTVFRDFNGNATKQTNEPGVPNMVVNAYAANDALIATQTTSSVAATAGNYSFPATGANSVAAGTAVRLEFVVNSVTATNCFFDSQADFNAYLGNTYGTNIRFVSGGATNVNFAISSPSEYAVGTNPWVATSIYQNGNLQNGVDAANDNRPFTGERTGALKIRYDSVNRISSNPSYSATNPGASTLNTQITKTESMGSVWGVTHSAQSDRLFYAAVVKRHSAIGPNGAGAIYWTNPNTTTGATLFANLTASGTGTYPYLAAGALVNGQAPGGTTGIYATGIPFSNVLGTNAERGLPAASVEYTGAGTPGNSHSYDAAAFAQAGKMGLGGIDISDDGKYIFVMNLFDRKLYTIEIVNPFSASPTAGTITSVDVPNPYGATGTARPWAVKFYRGKVYIGIVNDLSGTTALSGNTAVTDLNTVPVYAGHKGSIYSIPVLGSTFSLVTDVPLDYRKPGPAAEIDAIAEIRNAANTGQSPNLNHIFRYNKWSDNYSQFLQHTTEGNTKLTYPQAVISDIEFDIANNAIIVSVLDRLGLQASYRTFSVSENGSGTQPAGTNIAAYSNSEVASGDIIKISLNNTCVVGSQSPTTTGAGVAYFEFYVGDKYHADGNNITQPIAHGEIIVGGLALLPNSGQVLATAFDPSISVNSNGVIALQNIAAAAGTPAGSSATAAGDTPSDAATSISYGAQITNASARGINPAKGLGIGDIEILRELPPVEVGNRVWDDLNGDGIQNANEPGLNNVTIELYADFNEDGLPDGAALATVTTAASTAGEAGSWFFNNANVTDGDPNTAGNQAGLKAGEGYIVKVGSADWANASSTGTADLAGRRITRKDAISNGLVDMSDNDAMLTASGAARQPQIAFIAGDANENNHSLDFGFTRLVSLGDKVWLDQGAGANAQNGVQDAGEPGVAGVPVNLYRNGTDGLPGTADDVLVASTVTDAFGMYVFDNLTPTDQTSGTTIGQTSYNVRVTPPANYSLTTQTNTTDDNNTTGASTTGSDVNALGVSYSINLEPGENNPNIDAGIIFRTPAATNSIGDKVWFDADGNGSQNGSEIGVAGVTVTLYDASGNIVAVTKTDAQGMYLFDGLPANTTYSVGFTAPGGTKFTTGGTLDITNGSTNSDANPTTGRTTTFSTGAAGTKITGVDAGLVNDTRGAIGDKVWVDLNNNNVQDAGEPGVPGVTMTLYNAGADGLPCTADDGVALATTTTDANGNYIFRDLPAGAYFITASTVAGYTQVTKDAGTDNTKDSDFGAASGTCSGVYVSNVALLLPVGTSGVTRDMTVDLGIRNNNSATTNNNTLGNKVWNDVDKDGIQDAGEAGVPNVTVRLLNGAGVAVNNPATGAPYVVSTDANGNYLFVNLPDGNYIVEFANIPAGYSFTGADAAGSGAPGSGTDTDTDSDANTVTGRTGIVAIDPTSTNSSAVNIVSVDAGITQGIAAGTASLGNRVWYDVNNNGVQDAGELGVNNVQVALLDGSGNPVNAPGTAAPYIVRTNGLGEYLFTGLPAGQYQVRFSQIPSGFTSSTANTANQGQTGDDTDADASFAGTSVLATTTATSPVYTLQVGEDNPTVDMGIVPAAGTNSLGNFVWYDVNNNGRQDGAATESGVPGVTVTLYTNGADGLPGTADDVVVGTTTTDANGAYQFVGLADGNYNVGFTNLPAGFSTTQKDAPTTTAADGSDANQASGRTGTVALDPTSASATGVNDPNVDGGIVSTRAALGNQVWLDTDGDGILNNGEKGVSGVLVTLFAADGTTVISSTITDADGKYFFANLNAGTYVVGFSNIPSNLSFTRQTTAGNTDNQVNNNSDANPTTGKTATVVLSAGETDLTVDAGLQPSQVASVGDFVWFDDNNNGVQDAGEPGVPGIFVTIYDASTNTPVGVAVTDGDGRYLVSNLPAAPAGTSYYAIFSNLPSGAGFTTRTDNVLATDATLGSDPAIGTGRTSNFTLVPGQYLPHVDAGLVNVQLLPLRIVNFKASLTASQKANVEWTVVEQEDVVAYQVEYSKDGVNFTAVANQAGTGAKDASYSNVNLATQAGANYYRIAAKLASGETVYSAIQILTVTKAGSITIYPNPVSEAVAKLVVTGAIVGKPATITISSVNGAVVSQISKANLQQTEMINVSKLASGTYVVTVIANGEVITNTRLVVAK
jgi:hypothetical protein